MNLRIVIDVNVALDLLLKRPPAASAKASIFSQFKKSGAIFYIAASSLPILEYIHAKEVSRLIKQGCLKTDLSARVFARKQLDMFLSQIQILSSPGYCWKDIPLDHKDREDAMIGLSASALPEPVYIWTNDREFDPASKNVRVINDISAADLLSKNDSDNISFIDLTVQQSIIRNPIEKSIFTVLRHGQYIMGRDNRVGKPARRIYRCKALHNLCKRNRCPSHGFDGS